MIELEGDRIGKCQNRKVIELEGDRIEKCQKWKFFQNGQKVDSDTDRTGAGVFILTSATDKKKTNTNSINKL